MVRGTEQRHSERSQARHRADAAMVGATERAWVGSLLSSAGQ
jgi:hypothetical protein